MKSALYALTMFLGSLAISCAGESGFTYVYQVTDGLASEGPQVVRVYSENWNAHSGIPPFSLISTPNFPPSNSPKIPQDHNLLSASNISISVSSEEPWIVTVDASKASIPQRFEATIPRLLDLASEAISKTAKEWNILYKITVKSPLKAEKGATVNL